MSRARNLGSPVDQNDHANNPEGTSLAQTLVASLTKIDHNEIEDLTSHFNQRAALQKQAHDDWYKIQEHIYSSYQKYRDEFESEKRKADSNQSKFLTKVEKGKLVKDNYQLDFDAELKGSDLEKILQSEWFRAFKQDQSTEFINLANELAKKMTETRFNKNIREQSENINSTIDKTISTIEKCKDKGTIHPKFKHYLTELSRSISEKQRIDNIIPQILKDLTTKPTEYTKEVTPLVKDFSQKLESTKKSFETNLFKDSSNRTLYSTIDKEEISKVRASRYGFNITSGELATLRPGRVLNPSILSFFLSFLKEKTVKYNNRVGEHDKLHLSDTVFDVYKGEGLLYNEIGKESILLTYHKRLGFIIALDDNHVILVEIRKGERETGRELVIYDSDSKHYQIFHNKIYNIFRTCIGYDEPQVESKENFTGTRSSFKRTTIGDSFRKTGDSFSKTATAPLRQTQVLELKVANCPQQLNPYDSAVFAAKNASLLTTDKKIIQGSYSQNEINLFRYEIFNVILKIGTNNHIDLVDFES